MAVLTAMTSLLLSLSSLSLLSKSRSMWLGDDVVEVTWWWRPLVIAGVNCCVTAVLLELLA